MVVTNYLLSGVILQEPHLGDETDHHGCYLRILNGMILQVVCLPTTLLIKLTKCRELTPCLKGGMQQ